MICTILIILVAVIWNKQLSGNPKMPDSDDSSLQVEPMPKQQLKRLPKSKPHEGNSEVQQLVKTLSQPLKQSMVVSSETEGKTNVRAPSGQVKVSKCGSHSSFSVVNINFWIVKLT